jgi:hypothetical protein
MIESKDVVYYIISSISILITGIFSLLVWIATKESANASKATAEMAAATLELNRLTIERQEQRESEHRMAMRLQYITPILKTAKSIYNALVSTNGGEIDKALRKISFSHGISPEEIAKYFLIHEVEQINNAWDTFDNYLTLYFKDGYSGNEMGLLATHAPYSIIEFDKLIKMLE